MQEGKTLALGSHFLKRMNENISYQSLTPILRPRCYSGNTTHCNPVASYIGFELQHGCMCGKLAINKGPVTGDWLLLEL
ncbi:hypothetical protein D3C78_1472520 [compost metagenome]